MKFIGALRVNDSCYDSASDNSAAILSGTGLYMPGNEDPGLHYFEINSDTHSGRLYDNGVYYAKDKQTGMEHWSVPKATEGTNNVTKFSNGLIATYSYTDEGPIVDTTVPATLSLDDSASADVKAAFDAWVAAGGNPTNINSADLHLDQTAGGITVLLDSRKYNLAGSEYANNAVLIGESNTNGTGGDMLLGGAGNDLLIGSKGDDVLWGNGGNDAMAGGEGNDTYILDGSTKVTIEDKIGENRVLLNGTELRLFYRELDGSYITADGKIHGNFSGTDFIVTDDQGAEVTLNADFQEGDFGITFKDMPTSSQTYEGSSGCDWVETNNTTLFGNHQAIGSSNGDTLIIGNGSSTSIATTITGIMGDIFITGYGNSQIYADAQVDIETALALQDTLTPTGQLGDLFVVGALWYPPYADGGVTGGQQLYSFPVCTGNNTIVGGTGNDLIIAGGGSNTVVLGPGNNTYIGGTTLVLGQLNTVEAWWGLLISSVTVANNMPQYKISMPAMTLQGSGGYTPSDQLVELQAYQQYNCDNSWCDIGITRLLPTTGIYSGMTTTAWSIVTSDPKPQFRPYGPYYETYPSTPTGNSRDTIFAGSGNSLIIGSNGGNYIDAGSGDNTVFSGGGDDTILCGAGNSLINAQGGNDIVVAGTGNHSIWGGAGDNDIYGGSGDSTIFAGIGASNWADINAGNNYVHSGTGNTTVYGSGGNDTLVSGSETGTGKTTTIYAGNGDQTIFGGNGDDIIYGGAGTNAIYAGDGNTTIRLSANASETSTVYGGKGNDTIYSGAGNDILMGGAGDDTYVFNIGSGVDFIDDTIGQNKIVFGAGVDPASVTLGLGSLLIRTGNSNDAIHILGFDPGDALANPLIESIQFADGTTLGYTQLLERGFDIEGTVGEDVLTGTSITDRIDGGDGNDVLLGGAGADLLMGGAGRDTYVYNIGDGADTISDTGVLNTTDSSGNRIQMWQSNALQLGEGIAADMITPVWDGVTLTLDFGAGGSVAIGGLEDLAVQDIVFADGTSMSIEELLVQRGGVTQVGSDGCDVMATFGNGQPLQGGAGDDDLYGSAANDELDGGSGDDVLTAGAGDDILTGGEGNDLLLGGTGNDTYVFNLGDGADMIEDSNNSYYQSWSPDSNTLRFGSGITSDMIEAWYDSASDTVTLMIGFGGDSIDIGSINGLAIQEVEFVDGQKLTLDQLVARSGGICVAGSDENDVLFGTEMADKMFGLAGDDELHGGNGDDVLNGGQGGDYLYGGNGSDTYIFNLGDGEDVIIDSPWDCDYETLYPAFNTLQLGNGIVPGMLDHWVDQSGNTILDFGNGDRINIGRYSSDPQQDQTAIQVIKFADGGVFTINDVLNGGILQHQITDQHTYQNDQFSFTVPSNPFHMPDGMLYTYSASLANGDVLPSWLAFDSDTGTFSGVASNWDVGSLDVTLIATDEAGNASSSDFRLDVLNVNDAPTVEMSLPDASVEVGQGFSYELPKAALQDFMGDPTDTGTAEFAWSNYDSVLHGSGGNDLYTFARGDGNVYVYDWDGASSDTVQFADVLPEDITISQDQWGDVILSVAGTTDGLTLEGWLYSDQAKVEQVIFADGTVWGIDDIRSWLSEAPTPGNDYINGMNSGVTIFALAGDDAIKGGAGDDTLLGGAGNDALEGGTGSDILIGGSGADDIGSDWNYTDTANDLLDSGSGDDYVYGGISNDLLIGGAGDEEVSGDDGNDVILFNRGDGNDWCYQGWSKNGLDVAQRSDTISLGGGIGYGDLSFIRVGYNLILDAGNDESITFEDWFTSQDNQAISRLQIITEAMPGYDPNAADLLLNKRVQQFDFVALANQFEADLAADPSITTWQLAPHLADCHLSGSDTAAIGGAMAYLYGKNGSLDGLSEAEVRAQLNDVSFGSASQTLNPVAIGAGNLVFTDVDFIHGDSLTYSATLADGSPLPSWLTFDPAAQTFSGTPGSVDADSLNVAVTATDLAGASATTAFLLNVVSLNGAPVANPDTVTTGEDNVQTVIPVSDLLANDNDIDVGDSISLTGFDAVTANGNAVMQDAQGNLVFQLVNDYQSLGAGQTATDSFTYTITDTAGAISTATVNVTITGSNDGPVVTTAIAVMSTDEDSVFSYIIPAGTFSDIDQGDVLSYSATLADGTALPGWLVFDVATQTFSGTPGNGEVGSYAVTVTATDAGGLAASSTFALNVANVNDAPVVSMAIADQSTLEDAPFSYTIPAGTFDDVDFIHGDSLSYAVTLADGTALPAWLTFDAATQTFSGTPGNAEVGILNVRVTATDLAGASVSSTFALDVVNVNDAPIATDDAAFANHAGQTAISIASLLANDYDIDAGDSISLVGFDAITANGNTIMQDASGNLVFDIGNRYQYLAVGQTATDSFTYTVTDAAGATSTATVTVTITGANDVPVVVADTAAVQEDLSVTATGNVLANDSDVDQGTVLQVANAGVFVGQYGTLTLNADGSYNYVLDNASTAVQSLAQGQTVTETFAYQATDGIVTIPSSLTVSITGSNDAPVVATAIAGQFSNEDAAFSYTIPAGTFADIDQGDVLSYTATLADGTALPAWLVFDAASQTFSGTPGNGEVGNYAVTVTATDAAGLTASSTFALNVANVNDAPVVSMAMADQSTLEDAPFSYTIPAGTFTDADIIHGDSLSYTATLADGTALPSWLVFDAATQTFSGTPGNADVGILNVRVSATDQAGASVSATFALDVVNVNDAPVATDDAMTASGTATIISIASLLANDYDIDVGDSISLTGFDAITANGNTVLQDASGNLVFDIGNRYQYLGAGQTAVDTFSYTITDTAGATSTATVSVTITGANDGPVVVADTAVVQEDYSVSATGNVLANDSDVDQGTVLQVANAGVFAGQYGSLTLNTDGSYEYLLDNASTAVQSLAAGQTLSETFAYQATDGLASTASSLTVSILGSNDAPVVLADSATVREDLDITAIGNVLANDSDIDQGDTLSVADAGTRQGLYGSLTLNTDGSYAYSLDNASQAVQSLGRNAQVTEHFGYLATDGIASVASGLDILIQGNNDAPVLANALADQNATGGQTFTWQVPGNSFSDVDTGDTLNYTATQADGTALPSWLVFDPATRSFSGTAPQTAGFVDVMVTASDVAANGSTQGSLAASDVFRITVAQGNTGGGNGGCDDGHHGHHGNHGGHGGGSGSHHEHDHHSDRDHDHERDDDRKHCKDDTHADKKKDDHIDDIIHSWFERGSKTDHHELCDGLGRGDDRIAHEANRNVGRGINEDFSKQWAQMNAKLKDHLAQSGNDDHFDTAGASHASPVMFSAGKGMPQLGKSEGVQMKAFAGLNEGLERLGG